MNEEILVAIEELYTYEEIKTAWSLIWDLELRNEDLTEAFKHLLDK